MVVYSPRNVLLSCTEASSDKTEWWVTRTNLDADTFRWASSKQTVKSSKLLEPQQEGLTFWTYLEKAFIPAEIQCKRIPCPCHSNPNPLIHPGQHSYVATNIPLCSQITLSWKFCWPKLWCLWWLPNSTDLQFGFLFVTKYKYKRHL